MKYGVFSIYDKAAGVYTSPTIDICGSSAARSFEQAIANAGSVMNFRPSDFELYQVAIFDVESGQMEPIIPPSWVTSGNLARKAVKSDEV